MGQQSQTQSQSQSPYVSVGDTHANELWRHCVMSLIGQSRATDEAIAAADKVVTAYLANIKCREINKE